MKLLDPIVANTPQIAALRRDLHAHPELCFEEVRTADLVAANHILADQGVLDGFGHVSVRHPDRADCFLLARSLAPGARRKRS